MSKKRRNNQGGTTRQGVRDLNSLKGHSSGVRLEMPPDMQVEVNDCEHPDDSLVSLDGGRVKCNKCGHVSR